MHQLYGDPISGNCFKVALILHLTDRPFELIEVPVVKGAAKTDAYRALNPDGRVPLLRFPDGRLMGESNAMLCSLARGTAYRPTDPVLEDRMFELLFFEQYSHEPNIATVRFWKAFAGVPEGKADVLADKENAGRHALSVLDRGLQGREFLVGDALTVADIALFAYTHVAEQGGFALGDYPAIQAWLARVEAHPGFMPMPRLFADAPVATSMLAA
jgi:glutathione S-transferase